MTDRLNRPGKRVATDAGRHFRTLPSGIWAMGLVSLCMDVSSELVHSLLPVFLVTVLGASMATIGFIEGIAEATAAITKVFSGAISDYFRKRKLLTVIGYGLSALTKPLFPLATTIELVFAARFIDRIGKGIRGAPRDALVADLVAPEQRGAAYGLRQALDSIGACIGPLLAIAFMIWFANDLTAVLWIAVVPAVLAVVVLIVAVHEPEAPPAPARQAGLALHAAGQLRGRYWLVVALGALFTLARFSEAFLILRAQDLGLAAGAVPVIMIVMNVVYAAVAYPAGAAADRVSARTLLVLGLAVLLAADLVLAFATTPAVAIAGAACWGLHMALTQGLLTKLVADTAPAALRGTAFGLFHLVTGGALLLASVIAGVLWDAYGAAATFLVGATFAGGAMVVTLCYRPARVSPPSLFG